MSPSLSSPAPKEDPPLTPEDAGGFLQPRAREATIVKAADAPAPPPPARPQ